MKKNHSYNALKVLKIIRIILSILLLSYTLSLCIIGHCATSSGNPLPYITTNENSDLATFLDQITISSSSYSVFKTAYVDRNFFGYRYYENGHDCFAFYIPGTDFEYNFSLSTAYDLYDKSTDGLNFSITNFSFIKGYTQPAPRGGYYFFGSYEYNVSTETVIRFGNGSQNGYGSYLIPEFSSKNYTLYPEDSEFYDAQKVVFGFGVPVIPVPDDDITNQEKPEISDYMPEWDNSPTFDNSSVENALGSIFDYLEWFGGNIRDTITGLGSFIVDSIGWQLQKVIDNIRSKIQEVKEVIEGILDKVETVIDSIGEFFDYVSQPYDSDKINTAFNNMAIKSDYNNMTTLVNNAVAVFDSTAEPNTFRIPVHLENIPILHINEVQYIDLGLIYDSRSIIRAFMWCVTTFSLLYTIIDALPSYLQGNDE